MRIVYVAICAVLFPGCAVTDLSECESSGTKASTVTGPVYSANELTILPVPVRTRLPQFPESELILGNPAKVLVKFVITKEGKTANIEVIESTSGLLSESIASAVEDWLYKPGEIDNEPVNSISTQTMTFRF